MARRDHWRNEYHLEPLFRRFSLTIPLRRPLVVRYYDIHGLKAVEAVGLPERNLAHVLYLTTVPGRMVGIPKASVIDIRALYRS